MDAVSPLDVQSLCWRCDPNQFSFQTTDELPDCDEILGQARALDAVEFGIGIRHDGYNLFVLGPSGTGKRTVVRQFLQRRAADEAVPPDWCYVQNFDRSHQPKALQLPAGRGKQLQADMENLIDDLRAAIPAALEAEEHQHRVNEINQAAKEQQEQALQRIHEEAQTQDVQLIRTPAGFALAPVREGQVLSPEEFEKLPEEEQNRIETSVQSLQEELRQVVEQVPNWRKEARHKVKELNREVTHFAIKNSLEQVTERYRDLPHVLEYLEALERDIVENADEFHPQEDEPSLLLGIQPSEGDSVQQYQVNVLVDNGDATGAPVIYEDHPNFQNLLGRVEHKAHLGTLSTDFTLVKAGALHRANGGYLVIDALKMLQQPFAWEGLKRCLTSGSVKIESLAESLSLVSTVSLEPEPIPLDVKVVLLGERLLYYLLYQHDVDFAELFKVAADFEDEMDRNTENCQLYARFVGTLARRQEDGPLDPAAVARVIEHSAREANDAEKLTTHMRTIANLLRESHYWAKQDDSAVVSARHVERAIDKQIYRAGRIREKIQEEIERGTLLIDTSGQQVGQINGLSVIDLGNYSFGRPSRITATTRLGKGELIDIEREVELGGAIHSKGVLILSSFLAARFARNHPLSLAASLVFEQSYGMIDGDSASVAELCVLLSSLADIPLKQSLAVTGSVNQLGQVQPIGGVNQKIEGFFDLCNARGLTGEQGVLIPATNVKHLMLSQRVLDAAAEGRFHVYPIETIDQAVALLTGVTAGERDDDGKYPSESVNGLVEKRLLELFHLRQSYVHEQKPESTGG